MKLKLFGSSMLLGLATMSIAFGSVPNKVMPSNVTDDTALYQRISEIRVARQGPLNVESDLAELSRMEGRYQENLPALSGGSSRLKRSQLKNPQLKNPMTRVAQQKYRYHGR